MASQPRLCVNCKHFKKGLTLGCNRKVSKSVIVSPVTGKRSVHVTGTVRAADERRIQRHPGPHCGPDAKFYVEKRLTQRLIAKFKL